MNKTCTICKHTLSANEAICPQCGWETLYLPENAAPEIQQFYTKKQTVAQAYTKNLNDTKARIQTLEDEITRLKRMRDNQLAEINIMRADRLADEQKMNDLKTEKTQINLNLTNVKEDLGKLKTEYQAEIQKWDTEKKKMEVELQTLRKMCADSEYLNPDGLRPSTNQSYQINYGIDKYNTLFLSLSPANAPFPDMLLLSLSRDSRPFAWALSDVIIPIQDDKWQKKNGKCFFAIPTENMTLCGKYQVRLSNPFSNQYLIYHYDHGQNYTVDF